MKHETSVLHRHRVHANFYTTIYFAALEFAVRVRRMSRSQRLGTTSEK